MAYNQSCQNIRLDNQQVLSAEAADSRGLYRPSSLALNRLLGNINGRFEWGKEAFGSSARSIRLQDNGEFLVAELNDGRQWQSARVRLADMIVNDNGVLKAQFQNGVNQPAQPAFFPPQANFDDFQGELGLTGSRVDNALQILKEYPEFSITMINTNDYETKVLVVHPQGQAIDGPDAARAFGGFKVPLLVALQSFSNAQVRDLEDRVRYEESWWWPSDEELY